MAIENNIDIITITFTIIIIVAFFWAWSYVIKNSKENKLLEKKRWIEQLPSIISTLGVLGTFGGITIALSTFDTSDLDASIPLLLSGLKTAFLTSLAGMVCSLVLSRKVNKVFDNSDKGVSDINQAASVISQAVKDMSTANVNTMNALLQQSKEQAQMLSAIREDGIELRRIIKESSNTQLIDILDVINTNIQSRGQIIDNALSSMKNDISTQIESLVGTMSATSKTVSDVGLLMESSNVRLESVETNLKCISVNTASLSNINDSFCSIKEDVKSIAQDSANISTINDNVMAALEALGNLDASEQHVSEEIDKLSDAMQIKISETNSVLKAQFAELSEHINKINTQIANDILAATNNLNDTVIPIRDAVNVISKDSANIGIISDNVAEALEALGNLDVSEQHVSEEIDKLSSAMQTKISEINSVLKAQFAELSEYINKINTQIANDILDATNNLNDTVIPIRDAVNVISKDSANISIISDNVAEALEALGNLDASEQHVSEEIEKLGTRMTGDISSIVQKMTDTDKMLNTKFAEFTNLLARNDIQALTEYMKSFAVDFQNQMNMLINKLVQDNFTELNNSVKALNTWQQENKSMVEGLIKQYHNMEDSFEETSETLSNVEKKTQQLVAEDGKLGSIVESLNQLLLEDKNFIKVIEGLKEAANINKKNADSLNKTSNNLNQWISTQKEFVNGINDLIDKLDEISRFRDYNNEFWKDVKSKLKEGVDVLNQGTKDLNNEVKGIDKHFYARLSTTLANLDACIQAMYNAAKKDR